MIRNTEILLIVTASRYNMCNVSAYYTEDYDNAMMQLSEANGKLSEADARSAKSLINNTKKFHGTKEDAMSSMITDMEFSEEKAMKFINELW